MSTELKHTPGPWAWQKLGNFNNLVAQHGDREIIIGSLAIREAMPVETFPAMNNDGILYAISKDHPNAKLIAAAPEMFEVIKELYDWANKHQKFGAIYPKAEAAFKKATEG